MFLTVLFVALASACTVKVGEKSVTLPSNGPFQGNEQGGRKTAQHCPLTGPGLQKT
jgi:hypothetical protein